MIERYNTEAHTGQDVLRRTPFATMLAGKEIWDAKVAALNGLDLKSPPLKRETVRSSRDYTL